jgi:hypothetical protein
MSSVFEFTDLLKIFKQDRVFERQKELKIKLIFTKNL